MPLTLDAVEMRGKIVATTATNGLAVSLVAIRGERDLCALVKEDGNPSSGRIAMPFPLVLERGDGTWKLLQAGTAVDRMMACRVPKGRFDGIMREVHSLLAILETRAELFSSRAYGVRKALGERGIASRLYRTDLGTVRVSTGSDPDVLVVERNALSGIEDCVESEYRHDPAVKFAATVSSCDFRIVDVWDWRSPSFRARSASGYSDPTDRRALEALIVKAARKAAISLVPGEVEPHEFADRMRAIVAAADGADTVEQVAALRDNAKALVDRMFAALADRTRKSGVDEGIEVSPRP